MLSQTNFSGATFTTDHPTENNELSNAFFKNNFLIGTAFEAGINMSNSQFFETDIRYSIFSYSIFNSSILTACNFNFSKFLNPTFNEAQLLNCFFKNTKFVNSNISGRFTRCNFSNSTFFNCTFNETSLIFACDFSECKFVNCEFQNFKPIRCYFENSTFITEEEVRGDSIETILDMGLQIEFHDNDSRGLWETREQDLMNEIYNNIIYGQNDTYVDVRIVLPHRLAILSYDDDLIRNWLVEGGGIILPHTGMGCGINVMSFLGYIPRDRVLEEIVNQERTKPSGLMMGEMIETIRTEEKSVNTYNDAVFEFPDDTEPGTDEQRKIMIDKIINFIESQLKEHGQNNDKRYHYIIFKMMLGISGLGHTIIIAYDNVDKHLVSFDPQKSTLAKSTVRPLEFIKEFLFKTYNFIGISLIEQNQDDMRFDGGYLT